ncbi:hypothetical protein HJC23_009080 [Cyclotella cryptica]|uniref:Thioredoxin domain-containing protein n=1 Tax=Cyclotella cryptica TaxID=29204 RepID=A0ABD3QYU5_9STRA|eukprot:CCRYP_000696-RA/>CCRYP_000696-RA protein AED:0.04 eAED:0.04 QI:178/1/1/1/1/1/3/206/219
MMKQLVYFLALATSVSGVELTPDNWEAETTGKTVFIKFFAPWCGHCKAMAPDWEKLMADFEGSATQLVAEFDCTADGHQAMCEEYGVQGFPTLKYGDPSDLQDYQGPRQYEELKAFADENLKPVCSVANIDLCEGEKKEMIEKFLKMSEDDLTKLIEAEDEKIASAQANFEAELETLQDTYQNLQAEMQMGIEEIKKGGLSLMKSVLKSKELSEVKDEL